MTKISLFAKTKLVLFILGFFFAMLTTKVYATSACQENDWKIECLTDRVVNSTINSISRSLLEIEKGSPGEKTKLKGLAGFLAESIDTLTTTRPISSTQYFAYYQQKFHIPGTPYTAYAAQNDPKGAENTGYFSLTPILDLWVASRNLAYIIFTIVMVVSGLFVIFGAKIDPKTTASLQNALPKMVWALLLITFSYAIAGFLVDIMYVSIALVLTVMRSIPGQANKEAYEMVQLTALQYGGTIFSFFSTMNIFGFQGTIVGTVSGAIVQIAEAVANIPVVTWALGGGISQAIISMAIVSAFFQTWLALLTAFTNIILSIIFSPFQLLLEAIPGQNQFSGWVKGMLANILAFPAVFMMIFLAQALVKSNYASTASQTSSVQANYFAPPLIGATNAESVGALLAMGIFLSIPKVVSMLQEILKAPTFKFGSAWQEQAKTGQQWATSLGSDIIAGEGRQKTLVGKGVSSVLRRIPGVGSIMP